MPVATELSLAVLISVILSLAVGTKKAATAAQSLKEYFWANQSLRFLDIASLLLSTSFSFNGILYQAWLGYSVGWAALWLQVVWCLSYLWLARYADRLTELAGTGTLHGVIGRFYGAGAESVAAGASIVGFILLIGWEFACASSIFEPVLGILSPAANALLVVLALICATYTMMGGLRANAAANRMQNIVGGLMLLTAIYFVSHIGSGGRAAIPSDRSVTETHRLLLTSLGWTGLITNLVFSLCWQFVDMSNWQTIAGGRRDKTTSRNGLIWGAIGVFFFPGVAGTALGVFMSGQSGITSDNLIAQLFANLSWVWPWLRICIYVGFISAMLSTIDGLFLATAQAFVWDLFKRKEVKQILSLSPGQDETFRATSTSERSLLGLSRFTVMCVSIVSVVLIILLRLSGRISLFQLVYVVTIAQLALMPAVLSILLNRVRGNGFASIVAGLVAGFGSMTAALCWDIPGLLDFAATIGLVAAAIAILLPFKTVSA